VESAQAWRVSSKEIAESGYNLDLRNPHRPDDLMHRAPSELVKELIETESEILSLLTQLQTDVEAFAR